MFEVMHILINSHLIITQYTHIYQVLLLPHKFVQADLKFFKKVREGQFIQLGGTECEEHCYCETSRG